MAGRKKMSAQQLRMAIINQDSSSDEENDSHEFNESPPKRPRNSYQVLRDQRDQAAGKEAPMQVDEDARSSDSDIVKISDSENEGNQGDDEAWEEETEPQEDPIVSEVPTAVPAESRGRRNRSPMSLDDGKSDSETDQSEEWPTINVRKSLKNQFEDVAPTSTQTPKEADDGDIDMANLEEGDDEPSTLEKTVFDVVEEEPVSTPKNENLYMGPNETKKIIATVKDNWAREKGYLNELYEKTFPEWHLAMRLNANILVYGAGSKKTLLERFREQELTEEPTLVIDGFNPDRDLKMNIGDFCEVVTGEKPPKQEEEIMKVFSTHVDNNYEHFNMVVHSIDGPRFRNSASQKLFVKLAQIPKVHIVASFDHPNLPLLWNQDDLAALRWIYFHMSTLETYAEYPIPELTVQGEKRHCMKLTSLRQVFAGLTQNAKQIFEEIARYQIKDDVESATQNTELGMPYAELYKVCRAEFLVNSDIALRKQLVEYLDHDLLQSRRTNGQEYLTIPIDKNSLKSFLDKPEN